MRTLFLDLASHSGLIACVDTTVRSNIEVDHRIADHEVTGKIEECLRLAEWTYQDLEGIACVIGPGGFTSLRVAVAAANALSFALHIPSAGIHLSDLYRVRSKEKDVWWIHSTKKKEVFIRGFGICADKVPEARVASIDEATDLLRSGGWMGELIPEHQEIIGGKQFSLLPVVDVLPAFLAEQSFEKRTLVPWYGRGW